MGLDSFIEEAKEKSSKSDPLACPDCDKVGRETARGDMICTTDTDECDTLVYKPRPDKDTNARM